MSSEAWQPLAGVRVLDFSVLLPGPYASVILADLGADVIKVEAPAGDFGRKLSAPLFRMNNRNKRGIVLDLKRTDSAPAIERLTRWADLAFECFRPGVADRLGIGYEALSAINPRVIYCSLSGYGQTGPDRLLPGHDLNYLAAAGALTMPGHWAEPSRRSGLPVADLAGGTYMAIAMLAALHERERTGCGAYIDLSLAEAALAFTATRHGIERDGPTRDHLYPTNDVFETAGGDLIALGIVEEHFWTNFVAALAEVGVDFSDAQFRSDALRREHSDELVPRMRAELRRRCAEEWIGRFDGHDVPVSLVVTPKVASTHPQMLARETVVEKDGERHVPFPVRVNGHRGGAVHRLAPTLGEHTEAVLADIAANGSVHAAAEVTR